MTCLHLPSTFKLFLVAVCLFACFVTSDCHVDQAGSEHLDASNSPAPISQVAGPTAVYHNHMSLERPAEYSWVNWLNVVHWHTPAHCIQNNQMLSKFLAIRNNKLQRSQATKLWVDVLPPIFLNFTAQLAMNVLFWMKGATRKIEWSSVIQVYMVLNTSLSVTAMQSLPSRILATLLLFLLSPATKINKMGANGGNGFLEKQSAFFPPLRKDVFSKRILMETGIWRGGGG